ncbi:hypothetical protein [Streptomyces tendae]
MLQEDPQRGQQMGVLRVAQRGERGLGEGTGDVGLLPGGQQSAHAEFVGVLDRRPDVPGRREPRRVAGLGQGVGQATGALAGPADAGHQPPVGG